MIIIIFYILFFLLLLLLLLIIRGPSIWDRLLAFNLSSAMIILLILMYSLIKDISYIIDIAIVYTLLGYIGIIFISKFVKGKGEI